MSFGSADSPTTGDNAPSNTVPFGRGSLLQFLGQRHLFPTLRAQRNVAFDKLPYHNLFALEDFRISAELAAHIRRRPAIAHDRVHRRLQCQSQM